LLLSVRRTSGEPLRVSLRKAELSATNAAVWETDHQEIRIRITLDAGQTIADVQLSENIGSTREEVSEAFIEALGDQSRQEAAGLEVSDEDEADAESEPFPYDPESIRVDTKPFNISLVYEMINDGDINLSPDFQRRFVWTDVGARSRLIESIMLRIPLPVFYMAQDQGGTLQVVDGLQRLTVIKQFLDNNLRLRDLEYLKAEEGKFFRHPDPARCIDQRFRKRILQTQILMNIIDPQTPSDVKFDIFKRINQGGRPLNAQEIRNCMSSPETRSLLHALSESNEFLTATGGSVGTVRMQDQELVLRFVAFKLEMGGHIGPYLGNMERFLDQAIDGSNKARDGSSFLVAPFLQSMRNCRHLFGDYAFRKCLPADLEPGARRRLMNNSIFTSWSVVLSEYSEAQVQEVEEGVFATVLAEALEEDKDLYDSVSVGTNDRRRLNYAFAAARRVCKEHIG